MLIGEIHFASKGAVWLPHARGAGRALLQHLVDLLESETFGFGDEEVGEKDYNESAIYSMWVPGLWRVYKKRSKASPIGRRHWIPCEQSHHDRQQGKG
jgi:hypothetical protein